MSDEERDRFEEALEFESGSSDGASVKSPSRQSSINLPSRKSSMNTETASMLPVIDKKRLKLISETAEDTLDEDIKAVENGVDMFLNSDFHQAEVLAR